MEFTGTPSVPSDDSVHEEMSASTSMRQPVKLAGVKRGPGISTARLDQSGTSCTLLEAMAGTDLNGPVGVVMQQCMDAVAWDQVHQHRPLPYNYAADCTDAEFTQTCKEWMRVCIAMAGQQTTWQLVTSHPPHPLLLAPGSHRDTSRGTPSYPGHGSETRPC